MIEKIMTRIKIGYQHIVCYDFSMVTDRILPHQDRHCRIKLITGKSNDNWDAITTGCHSVQIGHPSSTNEPLIQHEWTPHSVPMEGDK